MKKMFKNLIDLFLKFMTCCYPVFMVIGILFIPFVFLVGGIAGLKECYFENKDLSFKSYTSWKKVFWKKDNL